MRKLLALAGLAALACGDDSPGGLSGTIGGAAFSPAEIVAATAAPTVCAIPGLGLGPLPVAAVAIRFATFTGSCSELASAQCASHRSSRAVTVIVAKAALAAGSAAVVPATYTVVANPTGFSLGAGGTAELALAQSSSTDASCADSPSDATGTLRLDEVSASRVAGRVDVTFQDGGRLQGDFSASVCPAPPDVCTIAANQALCTGTPTCL